MTKKRKLLVYSRSDAIALALNLCLVILEIKGMTIRITRHGNFGFEYYTQDSNLLMLIVAAMACFFILRKMMLKLKQKVFSFISGGSLFIKPYPLASLSSYVLKIVNPLKSAFQISNFQSWLQGAWMCAPRHTTI